jgi:hypothetical protein
MTETDRPARHRSRIAFVFAVLALVAVITAFPQVWRPAAGTQGSGVIEVGGRDYPFAASTCVIAAGSFVASGVGEGDDGPYVASISDSGLELVFGVTREVDRPEPGNRWWVAHGLSAHRVDGDTVRATALVVDRSGQVAGTRPAHIRVTCEPGR